MRYAIFLNCTDLYYPTIKKYGRKIDYTLLEKDLQSFLNTEELPTFKFAYGQYSNRAAHKFQTKLDFLGFDVNFFSLNRRYDLPIRMAVDIMKTDVDIYVIASNDPSLISVMEYLKSIGKTLIMVGVTSLPILRYADHTITIKEEVFEVATESSPEHVSADSVLDGDGGVSSSPAE